MDARATAIELMNGYGAGLAPPHPIGPDIVELFDAAGIVLSFNAGDHAASIARNMVELAPLPPGAFESVLEERDAIGDFHDLGAPIAEVKYSPPKDPRVKQLLRDAAAERAAQGDYGASPFKIFTDPRLDPKFKAKK